ncbi:hypothetical protein [Parabacteroides sp.]|uniref:hypothetical protein n=1 Tax=Parabacteroides sp. TaxID=1869337 RepID=UPI00257A521C|nr:hypothetical protein [Parabacteroides sp.]
MGRLVIHLKQHTPMWHFQAKELGCCLRASEVKPKLDHFFAEKKGKKYQPLDYKMYFEVNEDQKVPISDTFRNEKGKEVDRYPIYFGNIGRRSKELIYYKGDIDMHLFSLDTDILRDISKLLPEFFACTSFGTRQNKGFGFFYPKEEEFNNNGASYYFDVDIPKYLKTDDDKFVEVFKYIEFFHKMIRSGVNLPNYRKPERSVYYKSFMYHYAKHRGTNWDKPIIRHHFQLYNNLYKRLCGLSIPVNITREEMKKMYPELQELRKKGYANSRWLFRDALGLAGTQEWRAYSDTIFIEGKIENEVIKRFKSPITYRPVPMENENQKVYRVYIYLSPIPESYRKAVFTIKNKTERKMTDLELYKDFSLEDYFDYIIRYCNTEGLVAGSGYNKYVENIFVRGDDNVLKFRKLKK